MKQHSATRFVVLTLAALFVSRAGLADTVPVPPELINYVNQPAHIKVVLDVIRAQAVQTPICNPTKLKHSRLTTPGPVLFGANGQPSSGRWTETLAFDGCSQSGIFNVMTFVDKTGQIRTIGLLPGTTRANPILQRDAAQAALVGAFLRAPAGCKPSQPQRIIDTAFIEFSGASAADVPFGRDPRPWKENWTVLVCNAQIIVPLHFTPDATGTTFTWSGAEVRLK